ncbi:hypothetical protein R6Q59_010046 [Mikania micrantha]
MPSSVSLCSIYPCKRAQNLERAVTASATPPTKKSRKTASEPVPPVESKANEDPALKSATNDAVAKSRSSRKRASDFLGDDVTDEPVVKADKPEKPSKKAKKSAVSEKTHANGSKVSLTADGVNGIVETIGNAEVEIASAIHPASTSLEAEGLHTVDKELEEENEVDSQEDQGAALLAGFDSDSDDLAEDQGDISKTQPIPQFKKTNKKLRQAKEKGSDGPGTVYVGRIPHGFYEQQMRDYFTQFGDISRLRLSRNKRTGASKHFAFIEFASDEVAKIVAETMDNYLMFGHILKCKYAPSENLHPDVWKGANKKYRRVPHDKLQRRQLEAPKTEDQWTKKNQKERKKRQAKAEQMKAIGYEYVVPELKDPSDVIKSRQEDRENEELAAVEPSKEESKLIEAPPAVPADEVALRQEKKSKKSKSDNKSELLTQGNLDAKNTGPTAESAKILQNAEGKKNNVASADVTPAAASKKSKKSKGSNAGAASSHGELDSLSSIPVGTEAVPSSVTVALPAFEPQSISTANGVADTVLAGRKSDRKKLKSVETKQNKVAGKVSEIAPGAMKKNKEEKEKKLKGILKKGKKA